MNNSYKTLIVIILYLFLSSSYAVEADTQSATVFFNKYVAFGENYDSSMKELYSDEAKIHAYSKYPHGLERSMEFTGTQWKQLITKVMPLAKDIGDKSEYTDVTVETTENKATIKANRYSVLNCYTDTGYYMLIERLDSGGYKIVEEYFETQSETDC